MADFFTAPEPRCPVHGQMHHYFASCTWACHGWDGEGCSHRVRDEETDWQFTGQADGPFQLTGDRP